MRPRFAPTMSDAEAVMWRMEHDPYLSSTFGNITVLDRPADADAFRHRMEQAVVAIPRLRQYAQPAPGSLAPPRWVDDPDFDLDRHVRHLALPAPGSMRDLLDLATLLIADPFDRMRPLWQFILVDGLEGGRSALIQKMHHTIADGEASIAISMQYLDVERTPTRPPANTASASSADAADPGTSPAPATAPARSVAPSPLETARQLALANFRLPVGLVAQVRDLLADPRQIPAAGAAALDAVRNAFRQISDQEHAHSPLWTKRSLHRQMETVRAPLDAFRAAAKRHGGTVNTALLTVATQAAGGYHDAVGVPVDTLRASMAISTRTKQSGTNAFTLARFVVPTEAMPLHDRFAAIQHAATAARSATAGLDVLGALAATLPTSVLCRAARQQSQTVDFATSNVRAADFPLYIGGAKILANFPVGPLLGVAFNLTMMSYDGEVDLGINIDTAAVADPGLLREQMTAAIDELTGTTGTKRAAAARGTTRRPRRPASGQAGQTRSRSATESPRAPRARSATSARPATRR